MKGLFICMLLVLSMALTPEEKLTALRKLMVREGVSAYIIPSEDQHMSEYTPPHYKRRTFISSFTGSVGTAMVTKDKALLWVDGRYWVQAAKELPPQWTLMKDGAKDVPSLAEWVNQNLPSGSKVGTDFETLRSITAKTLIQTIKRSKIVLTHTPNLIDEIWTDRPDLPLTPLHLINADDIGRTIEEKVEDIRAAIKKNSADALLITSLADVCWTLNMRATDIVYNPYVYSYLFVTHEDIRLFIHKKRVTDDLLKHLPKKGVKIMDYSEWFDHLSNYITTHPSQTIQYYDDYESYRSVSLIPAEMGYETMCPTVPLKAKKNPVELKSMRKYFVMDNLALVYAFSWLRDNIDNGVTEWDFGLKTTEFRQKVGGSFGDSFRPIVATGAHAALPHYSAPEHGSSTLIRDQCILVDSGGQYHYATTDITRTMVFATDSDLSKVNMKFRKAYTLVMKGHLAMLRNKFPEGTYPYQIDILARQFLWNEEMNYNHGTGHGVGCYSGVHEDPSRVNVKHQRYNVYFTEGMTVTDEPGFYDEINEFGVRIENTCVISDATSAQNVTPYYYVEPLDAVPYQANILLKDLLTKEERIQIMNYNRHCMTVLKPLIESESVMEYMRDLIRQSDALVSEEERDECFNDL